MKREKNRPLIFKTGKQRPLQVGAATAPRCSALSYLPIESFGRIVGEEPVIRFELRQLNSAEVAALSGQPRWDRQEGIRELEEVCVPAPEFVPVDLCGVPLEGRDGHMWTCFQDGAPSVGTTEEFKI